MRYNNRHFPHPVLGIEDDITGVFSAELAFKSDKENISLTPTFSLKEQSIQNLIDDQKAYFLIQVYCSGTMYRQVFKTKYTIPGPFKKSSLKLRGEVEVHFFVCAVNNIIISLQKILILNIKTQNFQFKRAICLLMVAKPSLSQINQLKN